MKHKAAIIGAGPAGISCAVQLKRFGIDTLLFEKNQIGGLIRNAYLVENYLGFDNGISGQALVNKFKKHLDILDISLIFQEVKSVSYKEKTFIINTAKGIFQSEILVAASGTKPVQLPFYTELQELGFSSKIFYELADMPQKNYSNKKFAVIGAGDAAFDYALNLATNYKAENITVFNRSDKAKCLPLLEERALATGKIKHIKNFDFDLSNPSTKNLLEQFDFIIAAIGRQPEQSFFDNTIKNNIKCLEQEGLIHFIGDVSNEQFRQVSIACGDGIKAAMKIFVT